MSESIDVKLLSHEELQDREMWKAANKILKEGMQETAKHMKELEKAGLNVPQALRDRYQSDRQQYADNKAKQDAKDAIDKSIGKVTKQFNDFRDDLSSIRSALSGGRLQGGSVMHQAARMGLDYILKQAGTAVSGHAGSVAGAAAEVTGAARGAGAIGTAAGEAAAGVAGTAGMLGKAVGKVSGYVEAAISGGKVAGYVGTAMKAAGVVSKVAGEAAFVTIVPQLMMKWGGNKMYEQGLEIERRKTDIQISEQLFETQQAAQYSSQLSGGDLALTEQLASKARANTAVDWFSLKETVLQAPVLSFLFGEWSAEGRDAQLRRGQGQEIQERKHHMMALHYGKAWERKTDINRMINDARTNPQSTLALDWAREHSLNGVGSWMATLRGMGNGYGLGPTDNELLEMATRKQQKYMDDRKHWEEADRKLIYDNSGYRNSEHERTIWIDEVGKHRYKTTLNWCKI